MTSWRRRSYLDPLLVAAGPAFAVLGRAMRRIEPVVVLCDTWCPSGAWSVPVRIGGVTHKLARHQLYPTLQEAHLDVATRMQDRYVGWLRNSARNDVAAARAAAERARRHAEATGCDCCCFDCCSHQRVAR